MPTEASSNGSTTLTVKDGSLVFAKNTENPVAKEDYQMDFSPRHGSIMSISDEEYERLVERWGI